MKKNQIVEQFISEIPGDTVLIIPGGGYGFASKREALPVASLFNSRGYQAAIFEYRNEIKLFPEMLEEAFALIDDFRKNPLVKRLFIIGFSAGGHFALMLLENRPEWFSGGILAYPVVSTKPGLIHERSIFNLLGKQPDASLIAQVSLEDQVNEKMPPMFIWHTMTDESVSVLNSINLVKALKDKGVSAEAHIFPTGEHGLSIISEETAPPGINPEAYVHKNQQILIWVDLMFAWMSGL